MEDLVYFYPDGHAGHYEYGHPERPERVETIRKTLEKAGYWDPYPKLEPMVLSSPVLQSVHTPAYLTYLEKACQRGQRLDADTYTTPASWQLALKAAGGAATVAEEVWNGSARRGFALSRPPGHHATIDQGMGFCLLNNVALAAEYLIREHEAKKLAVLDLDLHHGNGTQDIFWFRADVFYFSIHQTPLYPGTGRIEEKGGGIGRGYNANIPLPPGSGDEAFRTALNGVLLPLLTRYSPQMLLISVGFDNHWMDPLGSLNLSASGNRDLISGLCEWADANCGGKIALVLEGGYSLEAASACALAYVTALLGEPWQDPLGSSPRPEKSEWREVIQKVSSSWEL
jgi:acetoin utilization deacetylase AcuC-like enzyme